MIIQERIKHNNVSIIVFSLILSIMFIYFNILGYKENIILVPIVNIILIILVFLFIKELNNNYIIKNQYDNMLNYLKVYEEQMERYAILNHERLNTLACIKSMVSKNSKAAKFIDLHLKEQSNNNYGVLKNLSKISSESIKGLLYYKLLESEKKDIYSLVEVGLTVDKKVFKNIDIETEKDVTVVLGVFLDNAIEACGKSSSKSMSIYVYFENGTLTFEISNTFNTSINVKLIGNKGYTTKGKGHGYGLSLVKSILDKNKRLNNKTEINGDVFKQYLSINNC